ncbi:T9SS type B sorting domain-containing protein [Pricia sp.]|uniref:T9SS type B sorting domain-containing protein n=1 Tax=Pricia sp. TaxID=2268138 RepID=UPI003593C267
MGTIFIFDRYGNLLGQIESRGLGWDGTYNGKSMPSSDYWFMAIGLNGKEFKGHLALKR